MPITNIIQQENCFIKDPSLRIEINRFLDFIPTLISSPSLDEINFQLKAKKDLLSEKEKTIYLNFSNKKIKDLDNFFDIEWRNLSYKNKKIIFDFSNNEIQYIDLKELFNFLKQNIDIIEYINLSNNPILNSLETQFILNVLISHFRKKIFVFDNKIMAIEDDELYNLLSSNYEKIILSYQYNSFIEKFNNHYNSLYFDNSINLKYNFIELFNVFNFSLNKNIHNLKGIDLNLNAYKINFAGCNLFNFENHNLILNNLKLLTLNLSYNPYLKYIPNFSKCISLKSILLNDTRVDDTILDYFENIKNLKRLNLSNTEITNVTKLNQIKNNNKYLKYLNLKNCNLISNNDNLLSVSKLKYVNLENTGAVIDLQELIKKRTHFYYLNLSGCSFINNFQINYKEPVLDDDSKEVKRYNDKISFEQNEINIVPDTELETYETINIQPQDNEFLNDIYEKINETKISDNTINEQFQILSEKIDLILGTHKDNYEYYYSLTRNFLSPFLNSSFYKFFKSYDSNENNNYVDNYVDNYYYEFFKYPIRDIKTYFLSTFKESENKFIVDRILISEIINFKLYVLSEFIYYILEEKKFISEINKNIHTEISYYDSSLINNNYILSEDEINNFKDTIKEFTLSELKVDLLHIQIGLTAECEYNYEKRIHFYVKEVGSDESAIEIKYESNGINESFNTDIVPIERDLFKQNNFELSFKFDLSDPVPVETCAYIKIEKLDKIYKQNISDNQTINEAYRQTSVNKQGKYIKLKRMSTSDSLFKFQINTVGRYKITYFLLDEDLDENNYDLIEQKKNPATINYAIYNFEFNVYDASLKERTKYHSDYIEPVILIDDFYGVQINISDKTKFMNPNLFFTQLKYKIIQMFFENRVSKFISYFIQNINFVDEGQKEFVIQQIHNVEQDFFQFIKENKLKLSNLKDTLSELEQRIIKRITIETIDNNFLLQYTSSVKEFEDYILNRANKLIKEKALEKYKNYQNFSEIEKIINNVISREKIYEIYNAERTREEFVYLEEMKNELNEQIKIVLYLCSDKEAIEYFLDLAKTQIIDRDYFKDIPMHVVQNKNLYKVYLKKAKDIITDIVQNKLNRNKDYILSEVSRILSEYAETEYPFRYDPNGPYFALSAITLILDNTSTDFPNIIKNERLRYFSLRNCSHITDFDEQVLKYLRSPRRLYLLDLSGTGITSVSQNSIVNNFSKKTKLIFKRCNLDYNTQKLFSNLQKEGWKIEFDGTRLYHITEDVIMIGKNTTEGE